MALEALIFDVDGTLAETEEVHRQAFNDAFAAQGLGWYWSQQAYRRLLGTTGGKERIARHMDEIGIARDTCDIAALHRAKTARYTALVAQRGLGLRAGVADLIAQAQYAGLRVAIATTTSRANVEALCTATFGAPANRVFEALACGDEVARKKPAPDVFLLALRRLGLPATRALAIEDSRNGLHAARAAGLACVVTPSLYTEGEDFTGAARVCGSLAELGGPAGLRTLMQPAH